MRNPYIIYSGAVNSAYMYFLMKQNEEAMKSVSYTHLDVYKRQG